MAAISEKVVDLRPQPNPDQRDKPIRILVVDDEEADRCVTTRVIGRTSLTVDVEEASSGADGLRKLRASGFDVILLDYALPDMNGEEFLDELRKPEYPAVATVMLTGAGDETIAATLIKAGAHDYLTKTDLTGGSVRRAMLTAIEKVNLLKDLDQQRMELQRSNLELEQYAYVTSHDLQEPLRIIVSFLQLFEKRYADTVDDKGREYIDYVVDGATRMQGMIASLLELSRIGRSDDDFGRIDLEDPLRHAIANLKMAIDESGAVITHDPLPVLSCREEHITQLFQNLIGNALKYRGDEAPEIHISVKPIPASAAERLSYATTVRSQTLWRFSVRDNGIGIDPKYAHRIFVVFQRLHGRGEYSGTGIGLALCKKIVETHHGKIWVKSEPDKGSCFYFTLPSSQPRK